MKNLLIILVLFTLASCVTKKKCDQKFPPVESRKDSISYKETIVYKDTVVRDTIPGDTVEVPIPVECDAKTNKPVNKKRSKAYEDQFLEVYFAVNNGQAKVDVIRKPILRDYLFHKIYSHKITDAFKSNSQVKVVVDKEVPIYIWLLIGALVVIAVLFKLRVL